MDNVEKQKVETLIGLCDKHLANFEKRHKRTTDDTIAGVHQHDKEPGSKGALDPTKDLATAAWLVVRQIREELKGL